MKTQNFVTEKVKIWTPTLSPNPIYPKDSAVLKIKNLLIRAHTKGVMQPHAILRRVLRRFFKASAFLEGFLEGAL